MCQKNSLDPEKLWNKNWTVFCANANSRYAVVISAHLRENEGFLSQKYIRR